MVQHSNIAEDVDRRRRDGRVVTCVVHSREMSALRSRSRSHRLLLWLAFLAPVAQLFINPLAKAERKDGVLLGAVRDAASGEKLEGAVVIVQGDKLQDREIMTTDSGGYYRLPNLPTGVYQLTVIRDGYVEQYRSGIHIRSGVTIRVDMTLTADGRAMSRTVEITPPAVDIGSSAVGMHIDSEVWRRAPIAELGGKGAANRSFEAIAEAAPGAQLDTYGTSFAGTSSPENAYQVDGLNVGSPGFGLLGTPFSVEFLEEVRVVTGGYMPEYGRAIGGVVNAITKSGSNEFRGSIWSNFAPGRLEGQWTTPQRDAAAIVLDTELSWLGDVGFDLGGPLIKDRLWFYTGFQASRTVYNMNFSWHRTVVDPLSGEVVKDVDGNDVTEFIPGSESTALAQGTAFQVPAKLTLRVNPRHRLELLGVFAPVMAGGVRSYGLNHWTGLPEITDGLGTFGARAHRSNNIVGDLQTRWLATTADRAWSFETTLGWHHQLEQTLASDGTPLDGDTGLAVRPHVKWQRSESDDGRYYHSATDFLPLPDSVDPAACDPVMGRPTCPVTTFRTGGPKRARDEFERVQARHMATRLVYGAGLHIVKFGVDLDYSQYRNVSVMSGGREYIETADGESFVSLRYGFLAGPGQPQLVDKLDQTSFSTTFGGFLQDSWVIGDSVTLNAGLRLDGQYLYGMERQIVLSVPTQFSPRVGVVWDPTRSGRSKLFASYGRFYHSVPLEFANSFGGGTPLLVAVHPSGAGVCDPSDAGSHEITCSDPAEWGTLDPAVALVDPDLKPQSVDEIVLGGEYEVIPGGRLGVNYTRHWFNRVIEDMSRDNLTNFFIGNPGYGVARDFPKARRNYDGVVVYFSKRFSRHWLTEASYTLSWLRGNIAGSFRAETGQLQANHNSDFDTIVMQKNRDGPLPSDHRHNFKVFSAGEVPLPKGHTILLGGAFRALSGGPTNALASAPAYGVNQHYLIPRGAGPRLPVQLRLDVTLGYRKRIRERLALSLSMTIFNVANFQAVTAVDERYSLGNIDPTNAQSLEELDRMMLTGGDGPSKHPNFGKPIAYQAPRRFQFGVRLEF